MPPKKKDEAPPAIRWARPGNTLRMGMVGLPNVGKSSLFNLLTSAHVPAENFPFCTIDPHEAVCQVNDERFEWLKAKVKPKSEIAAVLKIWDIAGLVPNAHQGEGLGNAFLSHIQAVDGLFHMIRAFDGTEQNVVHSEGEVDPVRDLEIIRKELIMKDLERCETLHADYARKFAQNQKLKDNKDEADALFKVLELLRDGKMVKDYPEKFTTKDVEILRPRQFITTKPGIYVVNMSQNDFVRQKNKWLKKIFEWVKENGGGPIIPVSVEYEENRVDAGCPAEFEGKTSQLDKVIRAGYEHLGLIHFLTAGEKEVRAWTIQKGTKAPQAAGVIHTDMERGFICLETYNFKDIHELGSEAAVKAAGKMTQKGKEYVVQDGDVCLVKFNVTSAAKKG